MNSEDPNGAVGKGVQPPDGTTERFRAALIVIHGIATTRSIDDRLHRIATLCQRALAEPSMSTTSPPENSGTDGWERAAFDRWYAENYPPGTHRAPMIAAMRLGFYAALSVEGGAKP